MILLSGYTASRLSLYNSGLICFYAASFIIAGCSFALWKSLDNELKPSMVMAIIATGFLLRLFFFQHKESDDIYRYIWEGLIQNKGFDPYVMAPNDERLIFLRTDTWSGINHKSWTAVYPPLAQLFCRLISYFSASVTAFKISFIYCDMIIIILLLKILKERDLCQKNVIFYAFHPLILLAFASEGHIDVLQISFMIAALLYYLRKSFCLAFFLLGMAISCKYTAILILPFWLRRENLLQSSLLILGFALPFVLYDSSLSEITHSLTRFATTMRFNDSLHYFFYIFCGENLRISTTLALLTAALGIVFISLWIDDPLRGGVVAFGLFLLFSPTVHFWYWTLLIPFLALRPSWPFLLLSLTSLIYLNVHNRPTFSHSVLDSLLIYIPFLIAVYFWLFRHSPKAKKPIKPIKPAKISLLLPFINEESVLPFLINSIKGQHLEAFEMIAIDGGSSDKSAQLLSEVKFNIISGTGGRGGQIRAGLDRAQGDIVLILHADMLLEPDALEKISNYMQKHTKCVGGSLGTVFENSSWRFRTIVHLNNLRAKLLGMSFGDQGQFFRRKKIEDAGCFKNVHLMEDVELSMAMSALGPTAFFASGVVVSTRRWKQKSVAGNALLVLKLLSRYLIRRRFLADKKTDDLFREYYGKKK